MNDQENKRQHVGSNKSLWLGLIAIIIAIIALITAGFSWTQYKQDKASASATALSSNIEQQTLKTTIQQLDSKLSATQQNVVHLMASINNNQQQSALSQIAYLINLANLQLNINHNVTSALHLIKLAQSKVDALDDSRLFALNKSLLSNIDTLKSIPTFNMAKIISKIDSLSDAIKQSDLMPGPKDLKKAQKDSAEKEKALDKQSNGIWYHRLWHHVSSVKNLVIIRRSDGAIKPLLSIEQQSLLKSIMQGKLLIAKIAVMQRNNSVFQQELNTLKKWINSYYFESTDRSELLSALETLTKTNINPKVPDISDTIAVLNQSLNIVNSSQTTPAPKIKVEKKPNKQDAQSKKTLEHDANPGVAI